MTNTFFRSKITKDEFCPTNAGGGIYQGECFTAKLGIIPRILYVLGFTNESYTRSKIKYKTIYSIYGACDLGKDKQNMIK